jgi:hypothetical protein
MNERGVQKKPVVLGNRSSLGYGGSNPPPSSIIKRNEK